MLDNNVEPVKAEDIEAEQAAVKMLLAAVQSKVSQRLLRKRQSRSAMLMTCKVYLTSGNKSLKRSRHLSSKKPRR